MPKGVTTVKAETKVATYTQITHDRAERANLVIKLEKKK